MITLINDFEVKLTIEEWQKFRPNLSIFFRERFKPPFDKSDDYVVTYEALFKSADLDRLELEIFSTSDGQVGFGIETRERVAHRIGVRYRRSGYAVGHEPGPISADQLRAVLDGAADGRIILKPKTSILGLGQVFAVLIKGAIPVPVFGPASHWRWLQVAEYSNISDDSVLTYKPW